MPSARAGLCHCLGSDDSGLAAGPGGAGKVGFNSGRARIWRQAQANRFLDTIVLAWNRLYSQPWNWQGSAESDGS